jgi:hypothetical protein
LSDRHKETAVALKPYMAREHEFEAQYGLPEKLPEREHILWQGSPDWRRLAQHAFHIHHLAAYFAGVIVLRAALMWSDGAGVAEAGRVLAWLVALSAVGLGLVALLAWLSARTSVYTVTNRRVVMRIGIVLTVAYNLPLKRLEAAALLPHGGGVGDIALTLEKGTRIAWLHLWPHARAWRISRPQPLLRAVPDAQAVAAKLTEAWRAVQAQEPAASQSAPRQPATAGARPGVTAGRALPRAPGTGLGPALTSGSAGR